ncbi:MAG: pyridoxine 5'-phosphate synthase [Gammaproteobacteria bacterium]|nr:MAG: pyridoxine 5'-phosphate synthase [Gammaproteobacteria bacterium]
MKNKIKKSPLLGVNIDHIATLRQARGTVYPQPVEAALIAEVSGADLITMHLREDRRHIQDSDMSRVQDVIKCRLNMEMAATAEMIKLAINLKPSDVCLVPEKREELTTEGGLDVINNFEKIKKACHQLQDKNINVSLFIDADEKQINMAQKTGAVAIELHTGFYADSFGDIQQQELNKIVLMAKLADEMGLMVNAGHGLHYTNVQEVAKIPQIKELNIGHSIIATSVFLGLGNAVLKMKTCIRQRE